MAIVEICTSDATSSFNDLLRTPSLLTMLQVAGVNGTVLKLHVDESEEELIIPDLDPDTQYTFTVLASNSIGSNSLQATQSTTSG